jgi:hypothetical protein
VFARSESAFRTCGPKTEMHNNIRVICNENSSTELIKIETSRHIYYFL